MPTPLISFLVLDYKKPIETNICLSSIRQNAKFDHQIIYLDNGSNESYSQEYAKAGLCDQLIVNKVNTGGGNGIDQLFKECKTKYACLVQSDQYLKLELAVYHSEYFIELIEKYNFSHVDLAGAQGGLQVYSERAGIMDRDFYLSIYRGEPGLIAGPGPFAEGRHSESFVQEYFKSNNLQIAHVSPPPFLDNGKWAIRELPCGGILKHACDTKEIWIVKPVKQLYSNFHYPPLNQVEAQDLLGGKWPIWGVDKKGRIPEAWASHSFKVPHWNE